MRKAQRKQAEDFLKVLEEAHGEIKRTIENKNYPAALGLLEDCQQGAISLGEMIESFEGEDCATIPFLEKYCEVVYQCHENILQGVSGNGNKVYKLLRSFLLKIEKSVKNDIKVRSEVVFLPYKASMWDSLESVWKKVRDEENCETYVVPIPYFDKNSDGSFGQMHYEGEEYPAYVPITDWRGYRLEEHRPDRVYIHNPYDNWNYVTSVHPDFYAERLKNYTEELVYIPYFILGEIKPDNEKAIEGMKHFCFLPGTIYADKVIVQSEDMRQIYIEEFRKQAIEQGITGEYVDRKKLEEKFLGLGSPKLDKVLNAKKEDMEIPKEWEKYIRKPDGSMKKIILYNNSITALLRHGEEMLGKMERVFAIFKEQQDEITLWWRPHPLIESTIKSMRTELWEQYEAIVSRYRNEDWGIYDDTADLDRAIVFTDAYYGDGSSLVHLYRKTGKPVMIQQAGVK